MASLNQIAYRVFESIRPEISDDDSIDIREIKYDVNNVRAMWLRREIDSGKKVSQSFVQDLGCIELEQADAAECCGVTLDCDIFRTNVDLPKFIETKSGPAITRVGFVDKTSMPIMLIPFHRVPVAGNGRFSKNVIYAFYLDNRLYLYSKGMPTKLRGLKYFNVRGALEDPTKAGSFTTCSGQACYTDDDQYPVHSSLIGLIEKEVIDKYVRVDIRMPLADTTNDGSSEIK